MTQETEDREIGQSEVSLGHTTMPGSPFGDEPQTWPGVFQQ